MSIIRWLIAGSVLLLMLISGCTASRPPVLPQRPTEPRAQKPFYVWAYHPWWVGDAWQQYDWSVLDELLFFDLKIDATGRFSEANGWPLVWLDLIRQARVVHVPITPTISLFSRDDFVLLFSSTLHRRVLVDYLIEAVQLTQAPGVHLDFEIFESVPEVARAGFTAFVRDLRHALDALDGNHMLTMYALAFDPGDVFDESALVPYIDYFVVQGYDLHWKGGATAGPVAPVRGWGTANWEAVLSRFLSLGVPRSKIIMALPFYGYEWPVASPEPGAPTRGAGVSVTYAPVDTTAMPLFRISALERVRQFGFKRDPLSQSPYYVFRDSTGWVQGWFEDPVSIREKIQFVKQHRLAGIAIFVPAYDNGELFRVIREALYESVTQ